MLFTLNRGLWTGRCSLVAQHLSGMFESLGFLPALKTTINEQLSLQPDLSVLT